MGFSLLLMHPRHSNTSPLPAQLFPMEITKLPSNPTCLASFILLLFITFNQSLSARTLGGPSPLPPPPLPPPRSHHHHNNHHGHHHHHHKSMTFYMPNVLTNKTQHHSTGPATTKVNGQLIPFSKPLGLFPPVTGIPLSDTNPTIPIPTPGLSTQSQTLDLPGIGMTFPASAANLQEELEFGMVTTIEVELTQDPFDYGSILLGKAKGMYVASSEDGSSQMMAMTASFLDNKFKDGLRFFGVHRPDAHSESHVAVIGGTGKFEGANGYATIKTVKVSSKAMEEKDGEAEDFLLVNVYLG